MAIIEDSSINPEDPMKFKQASYIASLFDLHGPVEVSDFPAKGNINQQTYLIKAGPPADRAEYLLQLLNPSVFKQPHAVMDAMISCILAQQKALSEGALRSNEEWETIRLVPTKEGKAYLEILDEGGPKCWRMMARIGHAHTYKSLREIPDLRARIRTAEEVGRGLAVFGTLTAGMDASRLSSPLQVIETPSFITTNCFRCLRAIGLSLRPQLFCPMIRLCVRARNAISSSTFGPKNTGAGWKIRS